MKRPADIRDGSGAAMKTSRRVALGLAVLLAGLGGLCLAASAAGSGQEVGDARRGREIYVSGLDSTGAAIKCTTGANGAESSAAVLKCANCHGADGRGRPEGGAFPSSIRWTELSKPYPVPMPSGRTRPPYSAPLLERAVASGIDPSGAPLGSAMPRYRLSPGAAADLIAYLKELDAAEEPGVGTDRITLGVMLPPERSGSAAGLAIRETLLAAFDEVNRTGGIYGRRLECRFATAPEQGLVGAWESFLAQEKPFAVLGSYLEGVETEVSKLIERERIPFIQSLPSSSRAPAQTGRYLFHLVAGWETQCAALARFAAENGLLAGASSLIVSDDQGGTGSVVSELWHSPKPEAGRRLASSRRTKWPIGRRCSARRRAPPCFGSAVANRWQSCFKRQSGLAFIPRCWHPLRPPDRGCCMRRRDSQVACISAFPPCLATRSRRAGRSFFVSLGAPALQKASSPPASWRSVLPKPSCIS